jgi:chromosome segregation ATPase
MRLLPSTLVVALAWGVPLAAESLDDLERAVQAAAAARDALQAERQTRSAEASRLADQIVELKRHAAQPRADRTLEQRLQTFDRVATALDDLDRRLRGQERTLTQARSRFMAHADADLATLAKQGGSAIASRIEAIDAARRRVRAGAGEMRGVRPALDIALTPEDGLAEVQAKLALLHSERQRLTDAATALRRELAIVDARLTLKRQLAHDLEAATGELGATSALVQREMDDLRASIREIERQREALVRDTDALPHALEQMDSRIDALSQRARQLAPAGRAGEIR